MTLLSVFFVVSPLLSCDSVKEVVNRRFRDAVCDCLLEAGRIGVVDCWTAQVWYIRFGNWMDGESRQGKVE